MQALSSISLSYLFGSEHLQKIIVTIPILSLSNKRKQKYKGGFYMVQNEQFELIDKAVAGDKDALESLICSVQDMIFNLSLRMLGTTCDAEDAMQEIIIKVMTQLSTFRKESAFSTWVYRIAKNYLINYNKSLFAKQPLSFEFYGEDIDRGFIGNGEHLTAGVDEDILAEELKQSCTNVMLQCLDAESRLIYVLGVMFQVDSKVGGEILGITPDAYRQRLSRIRKRVGEFLSVYCGVTDTGKCNCKKRVGYAIQTKRLDPLNLEYSRMQRVDKDTEAKFLEAMEGMDRLSLVFAQLPQYKSPNDAKSFIEKLIQSGKMSLIRREA